MRPLLSLTLALSLATDGDVDGPPAPERKAWPRPSDREPADDWSERTGIPSPFPCRAAIVWCDGASAMLVNPDGSTRGAWVPAEDWHEAPPNDGADVLLTAVRDYDEAISIRDGLISHGVSAWVVPSADTTHAFAVFVKALASPRPTGSLADGERWDPAQGEELWAYVARLSKHEQFVVWPDGPDGEPVPPTFVYRLRVDDDGDHYDLVPPQTAVATIDPAPLREAADQVADTANELLAAVDEALSAVGEALDDADDSH